MEDVREFSERFLQISTNILSTFSKFRPPVSLYRYDTEMGRVVRYCAAEERLGTKRQEEVAAFCEEGELFLHNDEYALFASHLSKNLGLLLTEPSLEKIDAAGIFHLALVERYCEFVANPTGAMLKDLKRDIAVFCEFIWGDSDRIYLLKKALSTTHDDCIHAINSTFTGISIYILHYKEALQNAGMNEAVLGLVLHDIGMSNVPKNLIEQDRKLINRERQRVEQHPMVGMKIIQRLGITAEETIHCVTEHHERWGGGGYPRGVKGEAVSIMGRICAVADSFSAMITDRVYAKGKSHRGAAMEIMTDENRYDPSVSKLLVDWVRESDRRDEELRAATVKEDL